MLSIVDISRKEATAQLDPKKRSELGQFMTPVNLAVFMASLFEKGNKEIKLLDAGAGVGSLSAAFLDRCLSAWGKTKEIEITAFDVEPKLLQHLNKNLALYHVPLQGRGATLNINAINADFIETITNADSNDLQKFTHAILNPPYKKINSQSNHRHWLRSVGLETVNLYSAFVSLALMMLKPKGELVAIIPRSFCNGNYYKSFRNFIISNAAVKRIHLFESRNKAFKDDDVLQENIIIHLIKGAKQKDVIITRSTDESLQDLTEYTCPFKNIVKTEDKEAFIHIPHEEINQLEHSEKIAFSLDDLGLMVSTGPVVDFRAKEYLHKQSGADTTPLLYPIHFNGKDVEWPTDSKKPNAITVNSETQKLLYPNGFYAVVRRFSSKEEKQRIIARVINPKKLDASFIGIENHLNVFHYKKRGISEDMAYGVAAYLNSTFVDRHFRSFNGHTQVNATDLRQMKYPDHAALMKLGKWAKKTKYFDPVIIDQQIEKLL